MELARPERTFVSNWACRSEKPTVKHHLRAGRFGGPYILEKFPAQRGQQGERTRVSNITDIS